MNRPRNDPAFALPAQTLLKLKPARDLYYLRRSIPDLAQFRVAFRLVKLWATSRGIYASKLGYLGGIHLSVMLSRVYKMLLHEGSVVSVPDLVVTFFSHYARFDWKKDVIFDPLFHKQLRYTRTFREPMCLLGWHAPTLNTAVAASTPTVKTIATEFGRADRMLTEGGLTWFSFLGASSSPHASSKLVGSAAEFLQGYKTYAKIEVHYWGPSLAKGSALVGWLESRCVAVLVGTWPPTHYSLKLA